MATSYEQTLQTFEQLQPGDRVELTHQVRVGFREWTVTTSGRVIQCQRRRQGLHFHRNFDDKAYSDTITLARDDGELTSVTLDEFTTLRKIG